MLHDTLPRLTKLRIDNSSQMNLIVASRFRDVKEIYINSLLTLNEVDVDFSVIEIDLETKIWTVPFLCWLGKLERVAFGRKNKTGEDI